MALRRTTQKFQYQIVVTRPVDSKNPPEDDRKWPDRAWHFYSFRNPPQHWLIFILVLSSRGWADISGRWGDSVQEKNWRWYHFVCLDRRNGGKFTEIKSPVGSGRKHECKRYDYSKTFSISSPTKFLSSFATRQLKSMLSKLSKLRCTTACTSVNHKNHATKPLNRILKLSRKCK